jgi:hypothetical protein
VYEATDRYLAAVDGAALDRDLDLSAVGIGRRTVGWLLAHPMLGNILTAGGGGSHLLPGRSPRAKYVNREDEMDLLLRAEMGRFPAGARAPRG